MDSKTVKCCGVDAISSFPDEILALILSFLPTKRAASTSILSRRWTNLFPLMNQLFASQHVFCLDNSDLVYPKEEERLKYIRNKRFRDFVDKILSDSNSIKKLSLKLQQDSLSFNQWLHNEGILMDLILDRRFRIPPSVFTSKTLVKLTLEGVEPRDIHNVFLPVLKSLVLHAQPFFTGKQLCHVMLLGCPILEELFLYHSYIYMFEIEPFSISHKTVKRLTVVHSGRTLKDGRFISFDTPSLVYLDYSAPGPRPNSTASFLDTLVQAKLNVKSGGSKDLSEVINLMRNVKTLSLSFTCTKVMNSYSKVLPIFVNLVKLSFESNTIEGWEMLPRLLNNSPKLETLVLKACIISQFRKRHFQAMMYDYCKMLRIFSNLVKLSFESNTLEGWEMLPLFLDKSPKLEMLVLKGFHSLRRKRICDCIDRKKTKVLEIHGFRGSVGEFRQVKCFLRTMQFLQMMKVEIIADDNKKPQFINKLLCHPKRSSKCKVSLL